MIARRSCLLKTRDGFRITWAETRFVWLILLGGRVTLGPQRLARGQR